MLKREPLDSNMELKTLRFSPLLNPPHALLYNGKSPSGAQTRVMRMLLLQLTFSHLVNGVL